MNTYDKIMESTYKLLFYNGFSDVSLDDIKEESGVGSGTIYYYFKNKDELITLVLDRYVLQNFYNRVNEAKKCKGDTFTCLKTYYEYTLGFHKDYKDNFEFEKGNFNKSAILAMEGIQKYKYASEKYMEFNDYMLEYISHIIENGKNNGEIRTDKTTEELTSFIESNIDGIFFKWIVQENFDLKKETESNLKNLWEYIRKY